MARPKSIISKAELAGILGLSKGRISQLSKRKDFPLRSDGRIDRERAVQWYHDDAGLGNGATKRGPKPKAPAVEFRPAAPGDGYQAILDALRRITAPDAVLRFAAVALRAGCSAEQAYVLATWYSCLPSLELSEVDGDDLADLSEPTHAQWAGLFGPDFDLHSAESEFDRVTWPEIDPDRNPAA
jgi:hypothetical protein